MKIRPATLTALILLAALSRLLPHPPNFAPITAMAVFGAVRYLDRRAAVLAPLLALLVSDLVREALYRAGLVDQWGLYPGMWSVYGATALVAIFARMARSTRSPIALATVTLGGSCLFFVLTNLAYWAEGSLYPRTAEGLTACFAAAIPFFRNALLGDVFYATALFGAWGLAESRVPALRQSVAAA